MPALLWILGRRRTRRNPDACNIIIMLSPASDCSIGGKSERYYEKRMQKKQSKESKMRDAKKRKKRDGVRENEEEEATWRGWRWKGAKVREDRKNRGYRGRRHRIYEERRERDQKRDEERTGVQASNWEEPGDGEREKERREKRDVRSSCRGDCADVRGKVLSRALPDLTTLSLPPRVWLHCVWHGPTRRLYLIQWYNISIVKRECVTQAKVQGSFRPNLPKRYI